MQFPWKVWVGSTCLFLIGLVFSPYYLSLDYLHAQAAIVYKPLANIPDPRMVAAENRVDFHQTTDSVDSLTVTSPDNPTIIGGEEAEPGAWPWMVALVYADKENVAQGQFCGGSLIHAEWILTAAHCTFELNGRLRTASEIDVVIGRHRLDSSDGVRLHVQQIIRHAGYTGTSFDHDLALLQLATPVDSPTIAPLPIQQISLEAHDMPAVVIGWGVTDMGNASNVLQEVTVPLVDLRTCRQSYGIFNDKVTENMICAGRKNGGVDSCQGDSGGPLMVFDETVAQWLQVGIVSWGDGCAEPNYYGVYTRVSQYTTWIQQQIPALLIPTETPTVTPTVTPTATPTSTPAIFPSATVPASSTPTAVTTAAATPTTTPTSTFIPTGLPMPTPTNTFIPTVPPLTPIVTDIPQFTPTAIPTIDSASEPTAIPFQVVQQIYIPHIFNADSNSVRGGSFESNGTETAWIEFSLQQQRLIQENHTSAAAARTGTRLVQLGNIRREVAYVYQHVMISADSPILEYWAMIHSNDDCGYDFGGVVVNDIVVDKFDLCQAMASTSWHRRLVNLSDFAGMAVTLEVRGETDRFLDSLLLIDDVRLRARNGAVQAAGEEAIATTIHQPIQRTDRSERIWPENERAGE